MKRAAAFILLLGAAPLYADWVDAGVKGGALLTSAIATEGYQAAYTRWTVGPEFDINLPFGLAIEFDALYKKQGIQAAEASSWEFPLLVKWKAPGVVVRPYLGGGFAFRHLGGVTNFVLTQSGSNGWVISGGLQIALGVARISPELRFTRWNNQPYNIQGPGSSQAVSGQNQFEALVGITF